MKLLGRIFYSKNVYEEHKPLLPLLQLFGLAPFLVRRNKARTSILNTLPFIIQSSCLLYCLYDSKVNNHSNRLSRYTLTVLLYDVSSVSGIFYTILLLARFLLKRTTCIRVWTKIEEMNDKLLRVGVERKSTKCGNVVKTSSFLIAFGIFMVLTYKLQTNKSKLTLKFWAMWYMPLFLWCLAEVAFNAYCSELKRKFSICNDILRKDIAAFKNGSMESASLNRVRTLRENHFRCYEVSRDLDSLYGLHFLYIFVYYFIGGTLNFCNIIRLHGKTGPFSVVRYMSAVYWTIIQAVEILNIVFSCALLKKEVQKTSLLVYEYLIVADDDDRRLTMELQSFSLQLMQCPLNFTAAGFFQIDCALLIQLGVGVISNTLFFVQIDKLKKRN